MTEPTLEGLPVELRISIMVTIADLSSLRSLVLASPSYYQTYRQAKREVLWSFLREPYAGLVDISDAIAAVRSRGLYAYKPSNKEEIIALLDRRRRSAEIRRMRLSSDPLPYEPAHIEEAIHLLRLHDLATIVLDDYANSISKPPWISKKRWRYHFRPIVFTDTEKRRFLRAFYRLQAYSNIFGSIERTVDSEPSLDENLWFEAQPPTFTDEEAWRLFFGTMTPWETEEIACLWIHVAEYRLGRHVAKASMSLKRSGVTLLSELPEDQRAPKATRFNLCSDLDPRRYVTRHFIASKGPALFGKILQQDQGLAHRNLVLVNAQKRRWHPHKWPRPKSPSWMMPLLYPADRFDFSADMEELAKLWDSSPPLERPNLAWRQKWIPQDHENPGQIQVPFLNRESPVSLWGWGYALWDDERFLEWDAPMLTAVDIGDFDGF
ncbi:hypothetical protein ASPCADRAFT_169826 [Aspergillus carbonarius ITEM 5010]|uniref:Uncharacterized protein n=1 Tax=Aspergillus carbonarius (strain ITEM 5010) TaxID=602072 RepID=A0A1R3RLH9_ASPC5|nr:hypothetical protein ASPCADRAFT_169826 [Aspergillus carbonarius ITEM 5010]